jgi:mycofactocin radical SAM maturase
VLADHLKPGLSAPICLTWELTYGCNLACIHCLSSSGRRDPRELSTVEAKALIDEFAAMQVFYVNIGGGEPLMRPDFFEIVEYAIERRVGVKFSTNGAFLTDEAARRCAALDYLDIQISLDGATPETNDPIRGKGSYGLARRAMDRLAAAGFGPFKINVVATRGNIGELDAFEAMARSYGAELRVTRLRPSGRGVDSWNDLRPTAAQQRELHAWLTTRPKVLTGDSFFHLSALGESLPGLNLCGAGRVVCLVDPVGDVYACPFMLHDRFKGGNVREGGGFRTVWTRSELFTELRAPQSAGACGSCGMYDACQGGCMAAKFFTGLQPTDPDPECVFGQADAALSALAATTAPRPSRDHSRRVLARVHS